MSGIVGIFNLDGAPVERRLLQRLSTTLAHRGPDGEGFWVEGSAGMACQMFRVTPESLTETQPLVSTSGTAVVFDGRLDNRDELLPLLETCTEVSADCPDIALVLAAYEVFGDSFPEKLNGEFALGLFDRERRQLLLARDTLGLRPLYYCQLGQSFLFASEIKTLLAHPRMSARPNDEVLADFLLPPSPIQDMPESTFFEDIFRILPAHMAVVTSRGVTTRKFWDFDTTRRIRLDSFEEYAEAFRGHFELAVRRRLRSAYPVAISVSGGLDSSAILCLSQTLKRGSRGSYPSLLPISYTPANQPLLEENLFLREIESAYDIHIERVPVGDPESSGTYLRQLRHVEAPILNWQWNLEQPLLEKTNQLGARVLVTGLWSDQLLYGSAYLIDLFRRLKWRELRAHFREFGRWFLDADPGYLRRRVREDFLRYYLSDTLLPLARHIRAKLVQSTQRRPWSTDAFEGHAYRHRRKRGQRRKSFATMHGRSVYEQVTSSLRELSTESDTKVASMYPLERVFPFLDRDLLSFLMSIPGEMQTWKGVPRAILRQATRDVLPAPIARRKWRDSIEDECTVPYTEWAIRSRPTSDIAMRLGYMDPQFAGTMDRDEMAELAAFRLWLGMFFETDSSGSATVGCHSKQLEV